MKPSTFTTLATSRAGIATGTAALAAALTAAWVGWRARRAESGHPPTGRFVDVDGVRLHYAERGEGPAVVLIHGNTVSLADFEASGLIDRLAIGHRVIAFDRPGFGHSPRPRDRLWTPSAQAALLHAALGKLGVRRPVIVGHSMGAMVALAMALDHPADVAGLALLGGYFYPGMRLDALLTAPLALPVLGDAMRYTTAAVTGRLMLGRLVKGMFAPKPVPDEFFPVLVREMMLRPSQMRANAEDAAFMVPQARASSEHHRELHLPVTIVAGADDVVVDPEAHSQRLHRELPQSRLVMVPGTGHMVHYTAADEIVNAVDGLGSKDTAALKAVAPVPPLAARADEAALPQALPLDLAA